MKSVTDLYNSHPGEDIYVIGTGPSLRVFPISLLENKVIIGLNMAWKTLPVNYGITIHPDLTIPEFIEGESSRPDIQWITKYNKTKALVSEEKLKYAEENFFFFESYGRKNTQPPDQPSDSGRMPEWLQKPTDGKLYVWTSIAQAGVSLAANMGAKNVIVIGCDNCAFGDNHHAHQQHARWRGADPNERYRQYYEGLAECRTFLRERGVNLVSMNPFLTLGEPQEDFERLCVELDKPSLVKTTADISPKISLPVYFQYYKEKLKNKIRRI